MDESKDAELLMRSATAMTAAVVAAANPTAGVLVAGVVPLVDEAARKWLKYQALQMATTLGIAHHRSGLSVDEFISEAGRRPETQVLLGEVLEAAARSTMEEKIRALGEGYAEALMSEESAVVEEERLWISMLGEIQRPHVLALKALAVDGPDMSSSEPETILGERQGHMVEFMWEQRGEVVAAAGGREVLFRQMTTTLVRLGLARSRRGDSFPSSYGLDHGGFASDVFWQITDLGREMLKRLGYPTHVARSR